MTEAAINKFLSRSIRQGYEYNRLIPKPTGTYVLLANGNTSIALQKIKYWSERYAHEAQELAKTFLASTLETTLTNVKSFSFNHFQYKIDGYDQLIRSLSRAWYNERFTGIDCKSYTCIISQILICLGIKHYLRRVGFDKKKGYSHVYVVVPEDQQSGILNHDYYVLDGTVNFTIYDELNFVKKDDLKMEGNYPIYGLAVPLSSSSLGCPSGSGQSCSCGCSGSNHNALAGIDFDGLINTIGSIDCIGGSAYSESRLESDLDFYQDLIDQSIEKINNYASGNIALLGKEVTKLKLTLMVCSSAFDAKLKNGWNSCTTKRLKFIKDVASKYSVAGIIALESWLNAYFTKGSQIGSATLKSSDIIDSLWAGMVRPEIKLILPIHSYTVKASNIPYFELEDYVKGVIDGSLTLSSNSFLNHIKNITNSFDDIVNVIDDVKGTGVLDIINPTPTTPTNPTTPTTPVDITNPVNSNVQKSGFSAWPLAIISTAVIGGIIYGSKKFVTDEK